MRTELTPVRSFAALGADWEALEQEAPGASVFQGWGWVGCLAEERYPDPVLLRAVDAGGRLRGLALFNRRAGALHLAESGDAVLDAPFIEHNAPLVAEGPDAAATTRALLQAAWAVRGTRRLVLSGSAPAVVDAAGGMPWRLQARAAPAVDLAALPAEGLLPTLSANARYQIRRSNRAFETLGGGTLRIETATTEAEALAWFDAMLPLHGETWRRRGMPGAFADPVVLRFHRALIPRLLARGELAMQRVTAGAGPDHDPRGKKRGSWSRPVSCRGIHALGESSSDDHALVVGYLYNLRRNGRVFAYQSGLREPDDPARQKPGLTCHALAIDAARSAGDRIYDFLAGDARYKRSLANTEATLLWAELIPRWSPRGLLARLLRREATVSAPAAESP